MKKEILQIIALFIIELIILLPISFALNIYNVQVKDVTSSSAKVSWSTDEYATGIVHYGKTTNLGYKQRHANYLFEHSLTLYGLEDETKYYVAIESTDINETTIVNNNSNNFYTFKTLDITPPEQVAGLIIQSVGINYVYIKWNSLNITDLSHYNVYRNRNLIANTTQTSFNDTNLISDTTYSYKVSAVDTSNNEGALSDTVVATTLKEDITLPTIAHVSVDKVTDNGAKISWLTDENATSAVYYGINQTLDKIKEDKNFVVNHTLEITGLLKGNKYSYKVSSCDKSSNCANSSQGEFEAGADLTPPEINVTIPAFYNNKRIDIIGNIEPYSKVRLFVNDMLLAARALDREETSDGSFKFYNVVLSQNNVMKIWAQDKAGNVIEKSYNLIVDMEKPEVNLEEIPSALRYNNLTIKGSVNEFATVNVYLRRGNITIPSKIENLSATAKNNSVRLNWEESKDEDFSHYVVYRDDVGAIAITKPASYNTYEDVLVNKGESYAYKVSAVNQFGEQGTESDTVTVLISEGKTNLPKPERIEDVIGDVKKLTLTFNASGKFNKSIILKEDGNYYLQIEFLDKALNKVLFEKEITLDTKPPEIKITKPAKGAFIYENYANEVDIEGTTEPFAEVYLYIERTPLGFLNKTFDISGLPNEIQDLPESDLRADCRLKIGGTHFCSTGADYSTKADSEGYFRFEDVDLTSWVGIGGRTREVSATELGEQWRDIDALGYKESREARLVFIATDQSGLRNAIPIKYSIGTCWAGNFSWEVTPLFEHQSPSMLSVERLREGTEHIFFYFKYDYVGRGENGRIKDITVAEACSDTGLLGSRFNLSCQLLPGGGQTSEINPEGTMSYTVVKLGRMQNMEKWLEGDWKDFLKAIGNEMTFPFKVRISYEHEVDGNVITEVQTTCQEVTYDLDNALIDFSRVLPDWVLYDFVDLLNDSIEVINKVQKELKNIIDYVAVGCVASYLLRLVVQIYRRWVSIFDEKLFLLQKHTKIFDIFTLENEADREYCNSVVEAIKRDLKLGGKENDFSGVKLKYFSDADLKRCFPKTASAWEAEAKLYNVYRFSCDRLFGHATPSKWTEQASDDQLYTKLEAGVGCAVDQSVRSQPLRAVKCREYAKELLKPRETFSIEDECFKIDRGDDYAICVLDKNPIDRATNVYRISCLKGESLVSSEYVIKQSETYYLTAQYDLCEEVCGVKTKVTNPELYQPWKPKSDEEAAKGKEKQDDEKDKEPPAQAKCIKVQECRSLKQEYGEKTGGDVQVTSAVPYGYTRDCYYKAKGAPSEFNSPTVVSDDPNLRYECCCINAVKAPPSQYYKYDDEVRYTVEGEDGPKHAFESKSGPDKSPQPKDPSNPDSAFADMKWSYRYWKEKYETVSNDDKDIYHFEYNPNRYIKERDFPACFGQNSWLYDRGAEAGKGNLLIMDPAKQHISAFQCLHIKGIYDRLQILKNMMAALQSCLITVRTEGRADTGVCKELFTQYMCSLVWYVIQHFLQEDCLPFGYGVDLTKSDNQVMQYVGAGLKSIWGSIADTTQELTQEYGNAKLNNLIGVGEEAVARKICLAAFGYDWELDLEDIVDAAYASPYSTLVQKMTSSREFLTVDPETNQATYEYRASWLINPGCDMRSYKVELSCVSRNEMEKYGTITGGFGEGFGGINCEKVQDPEGHNCDCLDRAEGERVKQWYSSTGKLTQGTLEDKDYHEIITDRYRYDHLKFTLYPDTKITKELRERCFPDGHYEDGKGVFYFPIRDKTIQDIADCYLDATQGQFICKPGIEFWTEKGRAHFVEMKINGVNPKEKEIIVYRGEDLVVEPTIRKLPGEDVCLIMELDKISDKTKQFQTIGVDGEQNYPLTLETNVQPARTDAISGKLSSCLLREEVEGKTCKEIVGDKYLRLKAISATNTKEETISIRFEDKWSTSETNEPDGEIDLRSDSQDIMIVNNVDRRKISEWWDKDSNAVIIDLEDLGIKLKVDSIADFDKKISMAEYNVEVKEAKEGEEQGWRIEFSLNNLRDNFSDCSTPGEIVYYQGKKQYESYDIKVQGKAKGFEPKISIDVDTEIIIPKIEFPLKVKVAIQDETGINDEGIRYILKRSDDKIVRRGEIEEEKACDDTESSGMKEKNCDIWIEEEDIDVAGDYYITVEARDTDKKPNTGEGTARFNVRCYNEAEYGICQNIQSCTPKREVENQILGCHEDFKCCAVGQIQEVNENQ